MVYGHYFPEYSFTTIYPTFTSLSSVLFKWLTIKYSSIIYTRYCVRQMKLTSNQRTHGIIVISVLFLISFTICSSQVFSISILDVCLYIMECRYLINLSVYQSQSIVNHHLEYMTRI